MYCRAGLNWTLIWIEVELNSWLDWIFELLDLTLNWSRTNFELVQLEVWTWFCAPETEIQRSTKKWLKTPKHFWVPPWTLLFFLYLKKCNSLGWTWGEIWIELWTLRTLCTVELTSWTSCGLNSFKFWPHPAGYVFYPSPLGFGQIVCRWCALHIYHFAWGSLFSKSQVKRNSLVVAAQQDATWWFFFGILEKRNGWVQ